MKTISSALQAHLDGALTTLAYLVKITRTDGVTLGFTTHDRDLTTDGTTFQAESALTPSAIESRAGLAVDNLDVTGILDSTEIAEADIENGLYDFARIDVYACNWADLTQGLVHLRRGWLGQVTHGGTHYVAELRGLHDLLQRPVGHAATPECRFDLGDASCGVDMTARTASGCVTSSTDAASFGDTAQTAAADIFAYGAVTWLTGANKGRTMEIKAWDPEAQLFTLWLPMPHTIETGDAYRVCQGCDKKFTTCRNVFANAARFGGFPHVPGIGNILKYPS